MKQRLLKLLALCACLGMLTACQTSSPDAYHGSRNTNQPSQNPASAIGQPTSAPVDPLAEEDEEEDTLPLFSNAPVASAAPTIRSEYAGATPVVIDPIDKPTPTPVPPLTFTYTTYNATKLHLSFEGPVGWTVDDTVENSYIIQNPNAAMDYAATLTIRAVKVDKDYKTADLKQEVTDMLSAIGKANFKAYDKSLTANRANLLLKTDGVYANYTGTLEGNIKIAGRVLAVYTNGTLYTVHITYPAAYTNTYKDNVYEKLRDTITITQ